MASVPQNTPNFTNIGGTVFGWLASQWQQFFSSKVDAEEGTADNLTLTGTINAAGATILGLGTANYSQIVINPTGTLAPTPPTNTLVQAVGISGSVTRYLADSVASPGAMTFRRADGTNLLPTNIVGGDEIGQIDAYGCTGSVGGTATYTPARAAIQFFASGTTSWVGGTSTPTEIHFATTPVNSGTMTTGWILGPNGGLYGSGATGGDKGLGTINASGIYVNGSALVTTVVTGVVAPLMISGSGLLSIPQFSAGTAGVVPASGGGTTNYLRADGTWTAGAVVGVASFNGSTGAVTGVSSVNGLTGTVTVSGIPTGVITSYAGGTAVPVGYLICDGSPVSRTTFATLFGVIGTTFGTGDGSTTFNVPDTRARVIAGYDAGNVTGRLNQAQTQGVSASGIGNTGGEQGHITTLSETATHSHPDPGHSHAAADDTFVNYDGSTDNLAINPGSTPLSIFTNTASSTSGLGSAGSGGAHNNVQPTLIMAYMIKT